MMKINFYDVEHGSCTHIITPNGKHIFVDIGSKADKSIVSHIRKKYPRLEKTDALIVTHPHSDHIYDLPSLYRNLKPDFFHRPRTAFDITPKKDTPLYREIATYANKMNKEYKSLLLLSSSPLVSLHNGGVRFQILSPPSSETTKDDLNTFSRIVVVQYKGYKFVLAGDNPKSIQQKMMDEDYCGIKSKIEGATVLLAPHHGRTGEFCEDFFKCVNPILSVVSDKSIVHSTQEETSDVYKGRGVNFFGQDRYVLTTRHDGTITFEVKGENNCGVYLKEEGY